MPDTSFENSVDASFEGTTSCESMSYCENIWVNPNLPTMYVISFILTPSIYANTSRNMMPSPLQKRQPIAPRDESRSQESTPSHTPTHTPGRAHIQIPSFVSAVSNSCGEKERESEPSYSERSRGSPSNSYPYRDSKYVF